MAMALSFIKKIALKQKLKITQSSMVPSNFTCPLSFIFAAINGNNHTLTHDDLLQMAE